MGLDKKTLIHGGRIASHIEARRIEPSGSEYQARIGARCQHPCGLFVPFEKQALAQSLADRFEEQVAGNPDRIALSCRSERFTYNDLNEASNRLAGFLLEVRGGRLENVTLLFSQSVNLIVAVLGVLKAGKCYIPLDPKSPRAHLAAVWEDSASSLMLTDRQHLDLSSAVTGTQTQLINIEEIPNENPLANPCLSVDPDTPAYIYYTSGSTGRPKGVIDTHRNVLHNVMRYTNSLRLCAQDLLSMLYGPSSSANVSDIFGALLNGAGLCVFNLHEVAPGALTSWLRQERVTVYHSVPSVFRHLIDGEYGFPELRLVRLEGERASPEDITRFQAQFEEDCILVNGLGATECGLVSQHFFDKQSPISEGVPIGFAVEDIELFLINEEDGPITQEQVGEIVVKSCYLAKGYWQQPVLTDEVFFPDPNGGKARFYRTRDLARTTSDGCLTHLGRCDSTVKIRGYSVDLFEVERRILELPEVKDAVVLSVDKDDLQLVAYVVGRKASILKGAALRAGLAEHLASYMIPSIFIEVDGIPYTIAGKVDRRSLPQPDYARSSLSTQYVMARTPLEYILADIWSRVLRIDEVSVQDDFIELGGDSIGATQVLSRVYDVLGTALPLPMLLRSATVEKMARVILCSLVEGSVEAQQKLLDWIDNAERDCTELASDQSQNAGSHPWNQLRLDQEIRRLSHMKRVQLEDLVISSKPTGRLSMRD